MVMPEGMVNGFKMVVVMPPSREQGGIEIGCQLGGQGVYARPVFKQYGGYIYVDAVFPKFFRVCIQGIFRLKRNSQNRSFIRRFPGNGVPCNALFADIQENFGFLASFRPLVVVSAFKTMPG